VNFLVKAASIMRKWPRWIHWIVRCLILLIISLIVVWALVFIVLPETAVASRRQRIVAALASAQSVRVEEFQESKILSQHDLDATQRASLILLIPAIVSRSLPISFKMCFDPHHRIVTRDSAGIEFTLTICFECDQAQHTGSQIYDMSPSGSAALRQLFKQNGVHVADPHK
jgi:hypothetical protein